MVGPSVGLGKDVAARRMLFGAVDRQKHNG
jgi:hypothetical protein